DLSEQFRLLYPRVGEHPGEPVRPGAAENAEQLLGAVRQENAAQHQPDDQQTEIRARAPTERRALLQLTEPRSLPQILRGQRLRSGVAVIVVVVVLLGGRALAHPGLRSRGRDLSPS